MQDILLEEKNVFKTIHIKWPAPPKWPETAVKNVWALAVAIPHFLEFMPRDWSATNHKVDRKYFWQTLGTLNPEYAVQLISDFRQQREQAKLAREKGPERIALKSHVISMLLEHEFKGGKSIYFDASLLSELIYSFPFRGQVDWEVSFRQRASEANHWRQEASRAEREDQHQAQRL